MVEGDNMRIAFITHATQRGGAAISNTMNLDYLIDNRILEPKECLLILPEGLEYGMYAKYIGKIPAAKFILPFSWIFVGAAKGVHRKVYRVFKEIISMLVFLIDQNGFLKKENITHIYLNSMVLWCLLPILPKSMNKTIHIRETFDTSLESRLAKWCICKYADKIITINDSTAAPFKGLPHLVTIANPVDMYESRKLRSSRDEIKQQMGIPKDTFVVSILAPIGLQKGYDFLERVMKLLPDNKKVLFLSVGSIEKDATILYNQLIHYPNFKHIDEQKNTDTLYAITDVVIRCEDYFPLGRTVFEGIYAGCVALLPFPKGEAFSSELTLQMHLYTARDEQHCASMIKTIIPVYPDGVVDNGFEPTGNVKEVSEKLLDAIKN